MALGPGVVNHVLGPVGVGTLLHPEDSVIVRRGRHQILAPVAIDVHGVDESGLTQIEVGMPNPLTGSRIWRRFKPTLPGNYVDAPIAVDIARTDSMTIRFCTHYMLNELAVL